MQGTYPYAAPYGSYNAPSLSPYPLPPAFSAPTWALIHDSYSRTRSSSPVPRLSLASDPRSLSLPSIPRRSLSHTIQPRLSLASNLSQPVNWQYPAAVYPTAPTVMSAPLAPQAYGWTPLYRSHSPTPTIQSHYSAQTAPAAPAASYGSYPSPYMTPAASYPATPSVLPPSVSSPAALGGPPEPLPTYHLAQMAFAAADAKSAAADDYDDYRSDRHRSKGSTRSRLKSGKSDGSRRSAAGERSPHFYLGPPTHSPIMRSKTASPSLQFKSSDHYPVDLRTHSPSFRQRLSDHIPLPIGHPDRTRPRAITDDPHLLYGGLPPTYRNPPPPPPPIVDDFYEPQQEYIEDQQYHHEDYYEEPPQPHFTTAREPLHFHHDHHHQQTHQPPPPPPPLAMPTGPPPPADPTYRLPPGRSQPYMYAHHAPLSPPGWKPGDKPSSGHRAHRNSFTAMPEQSMLTIRSPRSDRESPRQPGSGRKSMAAPGDVTPRTHMAMMAFEKFDADHSGNLDVREFHKAIRSLGLGYSFSDAENLFNMMDEDGNGEMSMQEFLAHCGEYIGNSAEAAAEDEGGDEPEAQARRAFRKYDQKRTGYFDLDTFYLAVKYLGLANSMEDAEQMFEQAIEDGSNHLDEAGFIRYCVSCLGGSNNAGEAFQAASGAMQFTGDPTKDAATLFARFDEDKNGYLDIYEFMRAIKEIGLTLSFEESKNLFSEMDTDGSGTMEVEEFTTHYINSLVKMRKK